MGSSARPNGDIAEIYGIEASLTLISAVRDTVTKGVTKAVTVW